MMVRCYIVSVASEDLITSRQIEDALENITDRLPGGAEVDVVKSSEYRSDVDKGIDPQGTLEENDRWIRLAHKELTRG